MNATLLGQTDILKTRVDMLRHHVKNKAVRKVAETVIGIAVSTGVLVREVQSRNSYLKWVQNAFKKAAVAGDTFGFSFEVEGDRVFLSGEFDIDVLRSLIVPVPSVELTMEFIKNADGEYNAK